MTPAELLELRIADVITDREYDTCLLHTRGMSQRTISLALGISRSAVRERLDNDDRLKGNHRIATITDTRACCSSCSGAIDAPRAQRGGGHPAGKTDEPQGHSLDDVPIPDEAAADIATAP